MSFCLWLSGKKVRNVRELIAFYDSASLTGYFLGGGLLKWLTAAGEDEIAAKVRHIKSDTLNIEKELAEVFGVPYNQGYTETCPQIIPKDTSQTSYNGSAYLAPESSSYISGSSSAVWLSSAFSGYYGSYTSSGTMLSSWNTSFFGYGSGFFQKGSYYSGSFGSQNYFSNSFNFQSFLSGSLSFQNYPAGSNMPLSAMLFRLRKKDIAVPTKDNKSKNAAVNKTYEDAYKNISELLDSPINRYGYGIYLI